MPLTQQFLASLLTIGSAEIPILAHLLLVFGASSGDPAPIAQTRTFVSHFSAVGHMFSARLISLTSTGQSTSQHDQNCPYWFLFPFCLLQKNRRSLFQSSLANPTPTCGLTKLVSQNQVPKKASKYTDWSGTGDKCRSDTNDRPLFPLFTPHTTCSPPWS